MIRKLVPYLVYSYVSFVGWTTRQTVLRADIPEAIHRAGERFIYAFWHQRQVFFTWSHRGVSAAVLVSQSRDGEMIARTMELSRIDAVRGSSSRGGAAAAREMVEILRSGRDVGITPDGPRGPAREVKEGAVRVAQLSGMPIVPIANALSNRLEIAKAWDRFQVPLPFGRSVVVYGEPVRVAPGDDLAAKAAELKAAMDAL
ncbi:MAG: lysophospholipid acyltransferase family protein, partial [Elusimicrobia bacterium]|nr:lysophospholipid acyltransferase family protein [Elusimicrobiota bacterium]